MGGPGGDAARGARADGAGGGLSTRAGSDLGRGAETRLQRCWGARAVGLRRGGGPDCAAPRTPARADSCRGSVTALGVRITCHYVAGACVSQ